jgi:4-methyl-5(b-hydroxyethyl)-thiazole monophosphate biosynthesis
MLPSRLIGLTTEESMSRICLLLAEGFEEIEAVTLIDVLRRAGHEVVTVGVNGETAWTAPPTTVVKGSGGIQLMVDVSLKRAKGPWDCVVMPGGMPGARTLSEDSDVLALVRRHWLNGGVVAACGSAPIVLGRLGLLEGKKATCYPGFEEELNGATILMEPVVLDDRLLTSRGPGTAMEFALKLVEHFSGEAVAADLRYRMLVT